LNPAKHDRRQLTLSETLNWLAKLIAHQLVEQKTLSRESPDDSRQDASVLQDPRAIDPLISGNSLPVSGAETLE
jgi:hypothetical protein